MLKSRVTFFSAVTILLLSVATTFAQGVCGQFVGLALQAVEESCNGIGRNQACYGFTRVEASFQTDVSDDFFTSPADVAEIATVETLRTAPLDLETDEWGVAVMVLQANMPETLPGQNVTFILMGDAEVENAVAPADAHQPIDGVDVTVTFPQGAAIRSGAGDNFNVLGGVTTGTVFTTDGLSEDGNWLRIVWEERPAWIRRTTVEAIPEIEALPTFNDDLRTPMQAFYLRTGIGQPDCAEVPDDSLLIQGPEDIEIDLTVNGANIQLGSSGILQIIDGGQGNPLLEITVLDGEFVVKADEFNPTDVVIRAGQRSTLCLDDGNNLGVDGEANDLLVTCAASPPEQIDVEAFRDAWCNLEQVPASLLNYSLQTCDSRTHTVQAGENLFRIAQFYCIELDDLIGINSITDATTLSVGQILTLPIDACDGTGSTRPPANVVTASDDPVEDGSAPTTDCAVSLVYPLQPVNSGDHTFQWTSVAGDNISYQLIFYTFEGVQAEVFSTAEPAYFLNLGQQTSTGGEFSWSVNVLQNGEFLCNSGRSPTLVRTGELNPSNNPPPFRISITCVFNSPLDLYEATLTWSNLPDGQSITFVAKDSGANVVGSQTVQASSGTETLSWYSIDTASATATFGSTQSTTCT